MIFLSLFRVAAISMLFTLLAPVASFAADTVEFLNGSKATGTVKSIRKSDKKFDFQTKIGGRTVTSQAIVNATAKALAKGTR